MVAPICCTTYHYAVKVFNFPNITIISIGYTAHRRFKGLWKNSITLCLPFNPPLDHYFLLSRIFSPILNDQSEVLISPLLPLPRLHLILLLSFPLSRLPFSFPAPQSSPSSCYSLFTLQVKYNDLLSLTEELVQLCIDDRTIDFTLALLDFVKWDRDRGAVQKKGGEGGDGDGVGGASPLENEGKDPGPNITDSSSSSSSSSSSKSHYQWPSFIINMLNKPTEWASWRKKVERSILSNREPGKLTD